MRILVISRNAWDDTNSVGNTLTNFFKNAEGCEFANIFFRNSSPNNNVCGRYFRVTEKDIVRHWFFPEKIGYSFDAEQANIRDFDCAEKKIIAFIHRYKLTFVNTVSDFLFDSNKWINQKFKDFIEKFDPDLVFCFLKSSPQYYWTIKYIHENCKAKIITWIADDEYSLLNERNKRKDRIKIERLRHIVNCAEKVYGCSEEICQYYNGLFNCQAKVLYKTCSFDNDVINKVNCPLEITYAGNLLYGRIETIQHLVNALFNYNNNGHRVSLNIFSNTRLSKEEIKKISLEGTSHFWGATSYLNVVKKMSKSDFALFIESFDPKELIKTRFSFSTKIIDCLQSGCAVLAIGSPVSSSIKYLKRVPGVTVIDDLDNLSGELNKLLANPQIIVEKAIATRSFAMANHNGNVDWYY